MAKRTNNNMIIGVCVGVVILIAVIIGIVLMNGKKGDNGTDVTDINEPDTEYVTDDMGRDDYTDIDAAVGFGDYDAMYAQAKAIQNGEMIGKIVQIDGVVSHPMSKYSVVEENENGEKIGTEFIIEGLSEEEYPEDGERIIITGEVIEKEPMYFVIKTTPEYVEIVGAVDRGEVVEEDLDVEL